MKYPFSEVENKWQKFWEEKQVYKTDLNDTKDKIYTLVMFIYPSGSKLHCGHWYNYAPTDSWARFQKLKGKNVFEPIGYDAFGLPAENYAIKTGIHPQDSTFKNIDDIRSQLKQIGCMYDWNAELMTCVPEYYRWNQWLFSQLYNKGLAYRKNAPVNWCDSCSTVLANEQVTSDGNCERCGNLVIQKNLTQWFFKITEYAEELLQGLDTINWPEKTKLMQKNWIGKSVGAEVDFAIDGTDETMTVFTTRPDTLYGVTYVVLAPENQLVAKITKPEFLEGVTAYQNEVKSLSEIERSSTVKEKTGVPTGAFAINPVNGEKVPVWIGDYVLATYGTGCVMAVPAHDERDFEFAKKFNLPIRKVILEAGTDVESELVAAFTEEGTMVNSKHFDGLNSEIGRAKIVEYLAEQKFGKKKIQFRLRDWLISRQRYWGTPIPVVHCPSCGEVLVPEEDLPVTLPYDVEFKPTGKSPLAGNAAFSNTKCPKCGGPAERDPDTMDTFVDSSWYYFRYLNPKISDKMFDTSKSDAWTPIDMYVGGAEHATMHLLYARFIHKFLRDLGLANCDEPFKNLVHQGTITKDGAKMSKSKGNVVHPEPFINQYGSDVFRLYLMFMGPYELGGDWSDKGITGTERFAQKVYDIICANEGLAKKVKISEKYDIATLSVEEKIVYKKVNETIAKLDADMPLFKFNTSIAGLMELVNELGRSLQPCKDEIKLYVLDRLVRMLSPLAPHLGEELNSILGYEKSVFENPYYYEVDPAGLVKESVNIAVQVNGKLRATIEMANDSEQEIALQLAKADEKVQKFLEGKQIVKEIFVKNKIVNIVVK